MFMPLSMSKGQSLDDVHGATVVCVIKITMDRAGNVVVEGSITDEEFALLMMDTARDNIKTYHARRRAGTGSPIFVPANDTALVGTNAEKKLLIARHELADAM
jgi:hypothetical protein